MERWEYIERYVLLCLVAVLLSTSAWFFFTREGIGLLLAIVPLPFAFWAFWQAFYEDRVTQRAPPTSGERFAASAWLWFRRITVGGVGAVLAYAAFAFAQRAVSAGEVATIAALALLSAVAFWVALFGGGRQRSMSDDLSVHVERKARYKWWL